MWFLVGPPVRSAEGARVTQPLVLTSDDAQIRSEGGMSPGSLQQSGGGRKRSRDHENQMGGEAYIYMYTHIRIYIYTCISLYIKCFDVSFKKASLTNGAFLISHYSGIDGGHALEDLLLNISP